jgi:protein involved in polysaccharide export with SLBB domain
MKKVLSLLVIALACSLQAAARTQSNNMAPVGSDNGKATEEKGAKSKENGKPTNSSDKSKDGKQEKSTEPATATAAPLVPSNSSAATSDAPAKTVATVPNGATGKAAGGADGNPPPAGGQSPADIYKVGIGDILDIRLLNTATRESTLFTVMSGGLLEYPLAGEPVPVAGFTTDEIKELLTTKVKVYENPKIVVSVREYGSHNVIVTGLVNDPGTKVLRREAMPLYVVLAEAQPRPEAGRAMIMRAGGQSVTVNLADANAMTTLVLPGDVITLTAPPPAQPQFFYIGGAVNSPGQKDFHAGMTLTQAVLASGGATRFAGSKVKISRQGADGRLATTEYNLKQIEAGKIPDPVLQPGDRLDVSRSGW